MRHNYIVGEWGSFISCGSWLPAQPIYDSGSAVVNLISSIAKLELTSKRLVPEISRL